MTYRLFSVLLLLLLFSTELCADPFAAAGGSYRAMREINVTNTRIPVVVTQFLHQGLINLDRPNVDPREENAGKSVLVTTKSRKPVPFRILQLGPGDYCRLAIQNDEKSSGLSIYYGIPADKQAEQVQVPAWTDKSGLLLETRRAEGPFGMSKLEEVKAAFEKSKHPIGADYVETVEHGFNPFTLSKEPFLSRYAGFLNVSQGGNYAFVTSSHHCSFLLIDGKTVAEQPGRRDRSWQARPEIVKRLELSQGRHLFEYYHAAADEQCSMLAVWQFEPAQDPKKLKLSLIPKENFGYENIQRVPAGAVKFSDLPGSPDFVYQITGSVPIPGSDAPMVAVQFKNMSAGLAAQGKLKWFFGDGQTSDEPSPLHIYLKPGTYSVELKSETVSQKMSAANRIEIASPNTVPDTKNLPTLEQYLPVLEKYDAAQLTPDTLLQLTEVYQAKIDAFLNPTEEELAAAEKAMLGNGNAKTENRTANQSSNRPSITGQHQEQVNRFRRLITRSVQTALVENPQFKGNSAVYKLTLLAGGIARDYLLDEKLAREIYLAGAEKQTSGNYAAECYALAADTALDAQDTKSAEKYLQEAEKKAAQAGANAPLKTFYRVKADYWAATGNGDEARTAIVLAEKSGSGNVPYSEQVAMQGSASRSAENFLTEQNYDRMIEAIRTWQQGHPGAAYDGYITLLTAKYWLGRQKYLQAAALADRQFVLNPDSPYIDELLLTAAEAQEKSGNKDAAKAYLHSLIKDYPGSPFVSDAQEKLKKM